MLPLLLIVLLITYHHALRGGLLWDDAGHVTPPSFRSLHGLWRIWTEIGATQQYYPLAHTMFWLQSLLWGDHVLGYHVVNIVLHAGSAFLLALILRRLAVPGAALAAFVFALHPVHVESVAWISELKNTLSTTLYLASVWLYLHFDGTRDRRYHAGALLLFVLALLSKTVTATLPAALLVVFWWQRGRLRWREDIVPLLPFLGVGVAAGLFTSWVETQVIGAHGVEFNLSLGERVLVAGRAVWFYIGKLLWPVPLSFVYPRWTVSMQAFWQYAFPLALIAMFATLYVLRRRSRAPLAALLIFCGTLFPALGFLDVYPFRFSYVADHFQYLASFSLIALFCAGIARLAARVTSNALVASVASIVVVATPLAALTHRQCANYESEEALYRATLRTNPRAWMAHNNLARLLMQSGRAGEARAHVVAALRLNPNVAEHHMNMGRVLIGEGAVREGIAELATALQLDPRSADAHNNLGVGLLRLGRTEAATAHFEQALQLDPLLAEAKINLAGAHNALGVAAAQNGRLARAIEHFARVVALQPDQADAHFNLALALMQVGRTDSARAELAEALRINPQLKQAEAALRAARGDAQ